MAYADNPSSGKTASAAPRRACSASASVRSALNAGSASGRAARPPPPARSRGCRSSRTGRQDAFRWSSHEPPRSRAVRLSAAANSSRMPSSSPVVSRRTSASMPVRYFESETSRAPSSRSALSAGASPSSLFDSTSTRPSRIVTDSAPGRSSVTPKSIVTRALPPRCASVARSKRVRSTGSSRPGGSMPAAADVEARCSRSPASSSSAAPACSRWCLSVLPSVVLILTSNTQSPAAT